jgi:hypothetical protein
MNSLPIFFIELAKALVGIAACAGGMYLFKVLKNSSSR